MDTLLTTLPPLLVPNDNTGLHVQASGRWVKLVSCTTPSVRVGFDNATPQRIYPGDCYPGPEAGFKSLWLLQDGAACTVVVQVANQQITGGDVIALPAMAASLAAIDIDTSDILARLGGVSGGTDLNKTNVANGALGLRTALFAALAGRRLVSVTAAEDNSGYVYIGRFNTVTPTVSVAKVLLPGGEWFDEYWTGGVWACGSDGAQNVYGYEE